MPTAEKQEEYSGYKTFGEAYELQNIVNLWYTSVDLSQLN